MSDLSIQNLANSYHVQQGQDFFVVISMKNYSSFSHGVSNWYYDIILRQLQSRAVITW